MIALRAAGDTHVGAVRVENEDAVLVDVGLGLYGVFDGMGGAKAGDVAAQTARDTTLDVVRARGPELAPGPLLTHALEAACAAVHDRAARHAELRGMGTTAVLGMVAPGDRLVVAHVGDSRAYLWRDGRLAALTADHSLVAELVARGVLTAEEAEVHPYRSVLSRNLGAARTCKVDVVEVALSAGDRVLLCSDGLTGYASHEAISHVLSSGDAPARVAHALIDLALRGGGGDNVSVIVLEAGGVAASATHIVRTSGATGWWQRRGIFQAAVAQRGLAASPVVAGLGAAQARQLLAEHVVQAVFHDLERSTAVNVWTFASGLAGSWLRGAAAHGEAWPALRALLDGLAACAAEVVAAVARDDAALGAMVEVAVARLFAVADLAIATVLAEQIRVLDDELAAAAVAVAAATEQPTFVEQATLPFVRSGRAITADAGGPEQRGAIAGVARRAAAVVGDDPLLRTGVEALAAIAVADDPGAAAGAAACELFGVRAVDEAGMAPLLALHAPLHAAIATGLADLHAAAEVRARTARRFAVAEQRLAAALAGLVIEAAAPASQRLRELGTQLSALRERLAVGDRQLARLERAHATAVDRAPGGGPR